MNHSLDAIRASRWFIHHDTRRKRNYPFVTHRFKCRACGSAFSDSFFTLSYRDRTPPSYERIFYEHTHGSSRRETAKALGCSLDTVQRRFRKMAMQALLLQTRKTEQLKIEEPVVYDGVENFAYSQYDPNNINHVVGKDSLFVYDFNFAPMNRKGKMSPWQKRKKSRLDNKHGRYPPHAIRDCTKRIIRRCLKRCPGDLIFHSDNHFAYRQAINSLAQPSRLVHKITPARATRGFMNNLFAINHLDNLTRQHLATFRRETIAFAKHSIAMIESYSLLMVWKNFMRSIFIKRHVRDPLANLHSPAMRLGIESSILKFSELFKIRIMRTQVTLNQDWMNFIARKDPSSRRKIAS